MTAPGSGDQGWGQQSWSLGYPQQQPHGYPSPQQTTGYPQIQQPWPGYPPQPKVFPPQRVPRALSKGPHTNPGYVAGSLPVSAAPSNPWTSAPLQQDVQEPGSGPQVIKPPDSGRTGVMIKCTSCESMNIRYVVEVHSSVRANYRLRHNESHLKNQVDLTEGIQGLEGTMVIHSSQDPVGQSMITLKCIGCGTEVIIDTHEAVQVRRHQCRSYPSPNSRIPNGTTSDAMAPLLVLQHDTAEIIREFVNQRKFYVHPRFEQELVPENVVGAYLPYFVLGGQAYGDLTGQDEVQTGS